MWGAVQDLAGWHPRDFSPITVDTPSLSSDARREGQSATYRLTVTQDPHVYTAETEAGAVTEYVLTHVCSLFKIDFPRK